MTGRIRRGDEDRRPDVRSQPLGVVGRRDRVVGDKWSQTSVQLDFGPKKIYVIRSAAREGAVPAVVDGTNVTWIETYRELAGAYLVYRRPAFSLGWWLIVVAGGLAQVKVTAGLADLQAGNLDPLGAATTWVYGWGFSLVMLGILGITLVYPSGRLPAGRGRRAAQGALGAVVLLGLLLAIGPTAMVVATGELNEVAVPNPLGSGLAPGARSMIPPPDILYTLMSFFTLAGLISMVVRFRRSTGLERLQFRWLVAVVAMGTGTWVIATRLLLLPSTAASTDRATTASGSAPPSRSGSEARWTSRP
jgi:hypothetical protein